MFKKNVPLRRVSYSRERTENCYLTLKYSKTEWWNVTESAFAELCWCNLCASVSESFSVKWLPNSAQPFVYRVWLWESIHNCFVYGMWREEITDRNIVDADSCRRLKRNVCSIAAKCNFMLITMNRLKKKRGQEDSLFLPAWSPDSHSKHGPKKKSALSMLLFIQAKRLSLSKRVITLHFYVESL